MTESSLDVVEVFVRNDNDVSEMESMESSEEESSDRTVEEKSVICNGSGKGSNEVIVEVEVVQNKYSMVSKAKVEKMVDRFLRRQGCLESVLLNGFEGALEEHVKTI